MNDGRGALSLARAVSSAPRPSVVARLAPRGVRAAGLLLVASHTRPHLERSLAQCERSLAFGPPRAPRIATSRISKDPSVRALFTIGRADARPRRVRAPGRRQSDATARSLRERSRSATRNYSRRLATCRARPARWRARARRASIARGGASRDARAGERARCGRARPREGAGERRWRLGRMVPTSRDCSSGCRTRESSTWGRFEGTCSRLRFQI